MKLKQTFGSSDFISMQFDMQRQSRRYMYMFTHILGIKTTLKRHYKQREFLKDMTRGNLSQNFNDNLPGK